MASSMTRSRPRAAKGQDARYVLFRDSQVMKDARKLLAALRDARELLHAVAEQDSNRLAHALLNAGFDFGDEETQRLVEETDGVISDAQGFVWSLDQAIVVLASHVPPLPGKKGGAG